MPFSESGAYADVRLMLLRDLERSLAERAPQHVALLAEIRALIMETESRATPADVGRAA